jgi:hypothetical protein
MTQRPNHKSRTNLYAISKAAMTAQLKAESADYAAAQKPERNQGPMHSGVNQLVRGSQNIVRSGTLKDPFRIG